MPGRLGVRSSRHERRIASLRGFKNEYAGPLARFGDMLAGAGCPPVSDADKKLVLHVALPILAGHVLMGTDCVESMGQTFTPGNNVSINLQPDTRAEAKRLFDALSEGGKVDMPLQDMFWGDYFVAFVDKFGTQWMVNCSEKPKSCRSPRDSQPGALSSKPGQRRRYSR